MFRIMGAVSAYRRLGKPFPPREHPRCLFRAVTRRNTEAYRDALLAQFLWRARM